MIWLLPAPSPLRKLDRNRNPEIERQLADGRIGDWVGEEPNHATARKPCPLFIIQYSLVEAHVWPSACLYATLYPNCWMLNIYNNKYKEIFILNNIEAFPVLARSQLAFSASFF